ncbi:MAG: c-type cytochrome [Woeseiaceae bacterium]
MTRRTTPLLLPIAAALTLSACPWDQDMVDQPGAKPQRDVAPPDPGAVPVEGGETLPAPVDETGMFDARNAAAGIPNPVPANDASVTRGAYLYEINCRVCHGKDGTGGGPVGDVFDPSPADLGDAATQDQADGQIFFTLTRGRGVMPAYRDALSHEERWHVINYLRQEFGVQ